MQTMRPYRTGSYDSRGRFRTLRIYVGPDGLAVRQTFTQRKGETERAVRLRADKWVVEMKGKLPGPNMTLARGLELWIEHKAEQGRAPRTIESYQEVVNLIAASPPE